MSEGIDKPWLTGPDVIGDKENLAEALSAEELAYNYKAETEEMLSFYDKVRKYVSYADVVESGFLIKLKEVSEPDERLKDLIVEIEDSTSTRPISLELLNEIVDRDGIDDMLFCGIRDAEVKKVRQTAKADETPSQLNEEAVDVAIGKSADILYSLDRYIDLRDDLATLPDADMAKIRAYADVNRDDARDVIKEVDTIKESLGHARKSKKTAVIEKVAEVGTKYKIGEERALRRQKQIQEMIERQTGRKVEFGIDQRYEEYGNIVAKDFLPAYINYRGEMRRLHRLLHDGKIVETKYLESIINEAMAVLTKNPPAIAYFHGDFGSGKTVLAVHLCRTRFRDAEGNPQEPFVVSGSKFLEPDRLTEEFRLAKMTEVELLNKIARDLGLDEQFSKDTPFVEVSNKLIGNKDVFRQQIIPIGISPSACRGVPLRKVTGNRWFPDTMSRWPSSVQTTILTVLTITSSFPLSTAKHC